MPDDARLPPQGAPESPEGPNPASGSRAVDASMAALSIVAGVHGKPADAAALTHRFAGDGHPAEATAILRAAKAVGLKARLVESGPERLPRLTFPLLAERRDGPAWFVLAARAPDGRVLVMDPTTEGGRPRALAPEALAALWTGRAILLASRASLAGAARRFDLTWFLPSLVRYRRLFAEVLLASFILQLLALATPVFFQVVVDKVLVHRSWSTLDVIVLALVLAVAFETLLEGLRTYTFAHTTSRVDVELGARLFDHAMSLPLAYFQARRVGDTVARARELENVRAFLTGSALTVVLDVIFGLAFLAVMYVYSPMLTLVVALTIPFYVAISVLVTPALRRRVEERFDRGAESQAFLVESVTAIETLKSMAVEPRMRARWEELLAAYVGASFRAANLGAWAGQAVQLVNRLGMAAVLWFGARAVMDGGLTVGELVAFNMLAGRVAGPVLRLARLWQDLQQFRVSVGRLGDILNAAPEPQGGAGRETPPPIRGEVRLERVGFRYRVDGPRVLEGVDLVIPAGQVVGIVGASGSGKSTLAKLVQRLHVPETGRVLVDGVDLALTDPAWLRRQVGVVPQDGVLLNRSVRDNIALAVPGAPLEAVVRAARLAGAHEFILELPHGYDTEVGERGTSLSGGQRQRIAIARALLGEPRILVLDEATSALDYESERVVRENLRAMARGRTVLIIAHRLAAVRDADRILVVERGRVVEDGTHEALVRAGARYAGLWRHQVAPEASR